MVGSNKYFYKVCIVGDSEVGKTTLVNRYLQRRFVAEAQRTIGSNFFVKYVKIPDVKNSLTLQIWDLAGQPRFKWVRYAFYKGARGIVYTFDLTRRKSLDSLLGWKEEVESKIGVVPNIFVGNKRDLINDENNFISAEEINQFKELLSACAYIETSAKLGINVKGVFDELAFKMYKNTDF